MCELLPVSTVDRNENESRPSIKAAAVLKPFGLNLLVEE